MIPRPQSASWPAPLDCRHCRQNSSLACRPATAEAHRRRNAGRTYTRCALQSPDAAPDLRARQPGCADFPLPVLHGKAALIDPRVGIALADHSLFARLVQALDENELPAMVGLAKPHPGPPREHIGKVRDIVLRITGADAERVQLQNFAGKVFV